MFLAACAWCGAGLYALLRPPPVSAAAEASAVSVLRLDGICLRQEEALLLPASAVPLAENGERIPAGAALAVLADGSTLPAGASVLFFSDYDGLEYLRAPETLDVRTLASLLAAQPQNPPGYAGRLVLDGVWYYAAFAPADAAPPETGPCRLHFFGRPEILTARLLSVSAAEDGRTALLFRLNRGGDYLSLRRTEAELYPRQREGFA